MSEKVVAGVIGQRYSDRRSGKTGVLIDRNEKFKTLLFEADDGSTFNICYSTFRSQWRKDVMEQSVIMSGITGEDVNVDDGREVSEPCACSMDIVDDTETDMSNLSMSDKDVLKEFIDRVSVFRNITCDTTYEGDTIIAATLSVDNFNVFSITLLDKYVYQMRMICDIDLYTDWGTVLIDQFSINSSAPDNLIIRLRAVNTSLAEILVTIEQSIREVNLYGYILEDNCDE